MAASSLIHTRFDLIHKASDKDADTTIGRFDLPVVPSPGELINLHGYPYLIQERAWSVGANGPDTTGKLFKLFAYVRVVKAGTNF